MAKCKQSLYYLHFKFHTVQMGANSILLDSNVQLTEDDNSVTQDRNYNITIDSLPENATHSVKAL